MKDKIILAAREAFKGRIRKSSDVSDNTVNAQEIAKDWRSRCWEIDPNRLAIEQTIHPGLNQRIDLVDRQEMCAYEFKVSGKNATAEFYKDIVKVILWNEKRQDKLKKFVFITEEEWGKKLLDTEMPKAFIAYLGKNGMFVEIEYIKKQRNITHSTKNDSNTKIADLVRKVLPNIIILCESNHREFLNLQDPAYCKKELGINFPFFRKANQDNRTPRYYKQREKINDETYEVTSEWFETSKGPMLSYIEKNKLG